MHRLSYKILLAFTVLSAIGGILTLLPSAGASYPNIIGYRSLCTFTPAASLYCFFIAGVSCFIRSAFIKDQSGSRTERLKKHSKSFIPLLLVLILAAGSTIWFIDIKAAYIDGQSAATEMEE